MPIWTSLKNTKGRKWQLARVDRCCIEREKRTMACMHACIYGKFLPSKVWPNCQFLGATRHEVENLPSLALTLKVNDSPTNIALVSHFWPQFRFNSVHFSLSVPFTCTPVISPAPPTFHTLTRLKYGFPVIVYRIPPCLLHGTLKDIY